MYGIRVNRQNKAICPFHGDRKPSLHVYDGKRGWFCFVCNEGGDVIKFVMRYFSVDFQGALEKLNSDFNLGLPLKNSLDRERIKELAESIRKKNEEREKRNVVCNALRAVYDAQFDRFAELDREVIAYAPKIRGEPLNARYERAIKEIPKAKYLLELAEMDLVLYEQKQKE